MHTNLCCARVTVSVHGCTELPDYWNVHHAGFRGNIDMLTRIKGEIDAIWPGQVSIKLATSPQPVTLNFPSLRKDNGFPVVLSDIKLRQKVMVEFQGETPLTGKLIPMFTNPFNHVDSRPENVQSFSPWSATLNLRSIPREVSSMEDVLKMCEGEVEGFSKEVFPMWVLSELVDENVLAIRNCDQIEERFSGFRKCKSPSTLCQALAVSLLQLLSFRSTPISLVDQLLTLTSRYSGSSTLAVSTLHALRGMKGANRGGLRWLHDFSGNKELISTFTQCLKDITLQYTQENHVPGGLDLNIIEGFFDDESLSDVLVEHISKAVSLPVVVFVPRVKLRCFESKSKGEGLAVVWIEEQYYVLVTEKHLREEKYDVYRCQFDQQKTVW